MAKIKYSKEPTFQLAWAGLHLASAFMHFGSAVYHLRKVRHGEDSTNT